MALSHISRLVPLPNANTRLVTVGPRVETSWLDEAYVRAVSLDAPGMAQPGFRLVWVRGPEIGYLDLSAEKRAFAVVGRHTRCDIVLGADAAVGLRHALVRVAALEDGSAVLHLLDLRTSLGFHLDDDVERRSLTVGGPLAVRIGRYALVALPAGQPLPKTRPATDVIDAPPKHAYAPRPLGRTSVTLHLPPPTLEDIARDMATRGKARVTLRRGTAWATTDLPDEALDRGVLVGRADRCESSLRRVMTESISRVHVMLLREHGIVRAYDLASEQGLYMENRPVRRVTLPDTGGTLRLAITDPVHFEWHPRKS